MLVNYHALWKTHHYAGRNPAPQPVSLERRNLPLLQEREYVVSDKSDGTRYVLFLTRANGRELAVMVDRKMTMFQVPVAATRAFFAGSIFDGELVNCGGTHVFMVFDVVAVKGSDAIGRASLLKRLELIRTVFDLEGSAAASPDDAAKLAKRGKIVCGGSARGLRFRPKSCFQLAQLDTLLRQLPGLPYATDGLVFTPVDAPVGTGTQEHVFKLKWRHTVDLEVGADEFMVGVGGAPNTAVMRAPLSSLGVPFHMDCAVLEVARTAAIGQIVELELTCTEKAGPSLSFVARRSDKAHPNMAVTVLRTLQNVRENIRPEELLTILRASPGPGT